MLEPQENKNREKGILFLSSNCQFSGASARTAYVEDLMRLIFLSSSFNIIFFFEVIWLLKDIKVDSYGECLHNTDWEGGKRVPSFAKMVCTLASFFLLSYQYFWFIVLIILQEEKIALMKQYKIVLSFENNNVSDFVSEKLFNAFQAGTGLSFFYIFIFIVLFNAFITLLLFFFGYSFTTWLLIKLCIGALPVYMGAPNVDEWLPGKDSIVKTSDFRSPAELATYLQKLLSDDKEYKSYFKWKDHKLSPQVLHISIFFNRFWLEFVLIHYLLYDFDGFVW